MDFIKMLMELPGEKRSQDVIDFIEWNNLWRQIVTQGNHSENYLQELYDYLFNQEGWVYKVQAELDGVQPYLEEIMTQPVGKAPDGSLWTYPSAEGPTTAWGYLTGDITKQQDLMQKFRTIDTALGKINYVNHNLLHNWYFVGGGSQQGGGQFPVNQRGQTSYTGVTYTVDRWYKIASGSNVSVHNDGLSLSGDSNVVLNTRLIEQYIENGDQLAGKLMTLSVLVTESTGKFGLVFGSKGTADNRVYSPYFSGTGLFTFTAIMPSAEDVFVSIRKGSNDDVSMVISAAKLELGSVQTLARQVDGVWVLNEIPDFGEQLARCQRYFLRVKNNSATSTYVFGLARSDSATSASCQFWFPTPMRAYPGVALSSNDVFTLDSPTAGDLDSTGFTSAGGVGTLGSFINRAINIQSTGMTRGDVCTVLLKSEGYIDFTADL